MSAITDQLAGLLEQQQARQAAANSRKGQRPSNTPSRAALLSSFDGSVDPTLPQTNLRQTVIDHAYPPCGIPMVNLRAMDLPELRMETVHRGRVLFGRIIGRAWRVTAVMNAIEDSTGAVDRLSVYHSDTEAAASDILPEGGVFDIKEPYYRLAADGHCTVRVDHPGNIVLLQVGDDLIPTCFRTGKFSPSLASASELTENGNAAFKSKDYR